MCVGVCFLFQGFLLCLWRGEGEHLLGIAFALHGGIDC